MFSGFIISVDKILILYIVNNVYFLGGAIHVDNHNEWADVLKVVRGTIYNGYCKKDYILQLYRAAMFRIPIGLTPLFDVELSENPSEAQLENKKKMDEHNNGLRIKNIDVTKEAYGHTYYRQNLVEVLKAIDFNA